MLSFNWKKYLKKRAVTEKPKFYPEGYLNSLTLAENKYLIAKMFQDASPQFKQWLVPIMDSSELLRKSKAGCLAFHKSLAISLGKNNKKYWFEKLEYEASLLKKNCL